jgi:streptomycin 6-kinase
VLDRAGLAALLVNGAVIARRIRLDGDEALAFLASLPELADRWQRRFELEGARFLDGGALSAALACTRVADRRKVILKLSAPSAHSARSEAAALAAWRGIGACTLLASGDDASALVLDAIEPGTAARPSAVDDQDALQAAELLARLRSASTGPFSPAIPCATHELCWRFDRARRWLAEGRAVAPVSPHELDAAAKAAEALHATAPRALCHGDFLNKNILLDHDGRWWAIDPMPCVGDPCLDAGFWALHHRPGTVVRARCARIAQAAGFEPDRVWGWARVFAASEAVLDIGPGRAEGHLRTLRGD